MSHVTDEAWRQILATNGNASGKIFHMSRKTRALIVRERGLLSYPTTLYGLPIVIDESVSFGIIRLEERS